MKVLKRQQVCMLQEIFTKPPLNQRIIKRQSAPSHVGEPTQAYVKTLKGRTDLSSFPMHYRSPPQASITLDLRIVQGNVVE